MAVASWRVGSGRAARAASLRDRGSPPRPPDPRARRDEQHAEPVRRRRARARPRARRPRARRRRRAARSPACSVRCSFQMPIAFGSCSFSGSGTSASRAPGSNDESATASGRNETPATAITRMRGSSHVDALAASRRRAGDTRRRAGRARARDGAARSQRMRRRAAPRARPSTSLTICVTRRSTATLASIERIFGWTAVLASEQLAPCPAIAIERAARARSRSNPNASHALVDARDGRLEHEVVAHARRVSCARDRRLDGGAAHLAVALRACAVARGEERAVDRDRQVERRAGNELLAVDVAAAARAAGSVECAPASTGGMPITPRNGASSHVRRSTRRRRRPSSIPVDPHAAIRVSVSPQGPASTVVDRRTHERLPGARRRAPRSARRARARRPRAPAASNGSPRARHQPALSVSNAPVAAASIVSTGSRSRERARAACAARAASS